MSHIIECSLNFKVDGINYPGFPLIRRLQVDQLQPLGQVQTALSPDVQSLVARREAEQRVVEAAPKLIDKLEYAWQGHGYPERDYTCGECAPGGEIVKSGWLCSYHSVKAELAALDAKP